MTPEEQARVNIDSLLEQAGWAVQDPGAVNASRGVAVREFALKPGHGTADYLLYVNQKAAGVVEAKPKGSTLRGVEVQFEKYSTACPTTFPPISGLSLSCTRAPARRRSSPTGWTRSREAVWSSHSIHRRHSPSGSVSLKLQMPVHSE